MQWNDARTPRLFLVSVVVPFARTRARLFPFFFSGGKDRLKDNLSRWTMDKAKRRRKRGREWKIKKETDSSE